MTDLLMAFVGALAVAGIAFIPRYRRRHDQRVPEQLRPRDWSATFDRPAYLRTTIARPALKNRPLWDALAQFHQEPAE
jgi:hypothetical protein